MSNERIANVIFALERIRERPAMFAGAKTFSAVSIFLDGFDAGCRAAGMPLPPGVKSLATKDRGWPVYAAWPVSEMQASGLTDEEIADEMIAIRIASWRRMGDDDTWQQS